MNPTLAPEVQSALAFWNVAWGLQTLLTLANSVLVFILFFRRRKPLDAELAEYVKHHVCDVRQKRLTRRLEILADSFGERLTKGDELFRHIERSLGRIEGKLEDLKKS